MIDLSKFGDTNVCYDCSLRASFDLRLLPNQSIGFLGSSNSLYFCLVVVDDQSDIISDRLCQIDPLDTGSRP